MWEEFSTYLKKLKPDVEFVQLNWPKLGETDHSSYITALLQSGAEGLFSSVWGAQSIAFVKQARPFGLFDKMRYVAPSVGNPDELDPLGKEAPIGAITNPFAWYDAGLHKRHPKLEAWTKKYTEWATQKGLKDPQPKLGASWGYASAYIIAEAIKRAKSTDPEKVIGVLSEGFEMDFPWGKVVMLASTISGNSGPRWARIARTRATSSASDGRPTFILIARKPRARLSSVWRSSASSENSRSIPPA